MKKHKIFDKKRLMSNTTTVMAILVAAVMVSSSAVSAVNISAEQVEMKNEDINVEAYKNEDIDIGKIDTSRDMCGLHPAARNNQPVLSAVQSSNKELSAGSNDAPLKTPFGKTMYGYAAYDMGGGPLGPGYFDVDEPTNWTNLDTTESSYFIAGGTYTCDGRWLGCEYYTGLIWEMDPETGEMDEIGGGGEYFNGLAMDPIYNRLYAVSSGGGALFEIDPETGAQSYIGAVGFDTVYYSMIAIAFDNNDTLWGWTVSYYYRSQIYKIDRNSGKGTWVAEMDLNLLYAQDGDFDRETNTLYLTACAGAWPGRLYTCNVTTGETELIDDIGEGVECTASMFIQGCPVPEHDISVEEIISPPERMRATPDIPMKIRVKKQWGTR
jgi:hypothetical protein